MGAPRDLLLALCSLSCVLVGLVLLTAGVVLYVQFPAIIEHEVGKVRDGTGSKQKCLCVVANM